MPSAFVIHLHSGHGPAHYDLMLQCGGALATWRLPADPGALEPGGEIPAERLADHRQAYLTYEGPVSRGRGRVRRVHRGTCRLVRAQAARWSFGLSAETCRGRFELRRSADDPERWTLRRLADEPQ